MTKRKDQIARVVHSSSAPSPARRRRKKKRKQKSDLTHPHRLTRVNAPNAAKTPAPSSLTYSPFPLNSSPGPITPQSRNHTHSRSPLSKNTPRQLRAIVDSAPTVAAA